MAEQGEPLSEREQDVLERLAIGSTNREIALELSISPNTVKVHVRNIFVKLGVSSRTEATTVAIQKGLLTVPGATPVAETDEVEAEPDPDHSKSQLEATGELQPHVEVEESQTSRPWRIIAFVVILAAGLLIGAVVSAWLLGDGDVAPTSAPSPTVEPFVEEPLGDSNWRIGRRLPRERADMAVASVGLDLYIIGGEVEAGVVNLVDVYETKSGLWGSAASKPTAVTDATAAVLFGEIFVPGGRLADGQPTSVVEAYSPANNAWRPVGALPTQVGGGLALSDGSQLYLLGGWDGERYLTDAYVYDPAADAWESLPSMTIGRADAAGDVIGGRLYVVGGFDGQRELDACEYFDVATSQWFPCANLHMARA
jgi:DNA-binding CsgD family transcriptional regulator